MSATSAIFISLGICAAAAALEGVCAGKNVKAFFATLRFPQYSAPLWVWTIIGGLYYLIFWFALYRLLRLNSSGLRVAALALILLMMIVNALANYVIFRARDLRLSFIVTCIFPFMDVALFICLIRLDGPAAWSLIPYLLYRLYSLWWGYGLWKLNSRAA